MAFYVLIWRQETTHTITISRRHVIPKAEHLDPESKHFSTTPSKDCLHSQL